MIAGPMFLVSNEKLVAAVSEAGGIGAAPSLNWRSTKEFHAAVKLIKSMTGKPYGINLIVNKAVTRTHKDLEVCVEEKVPFVITSLGNPKEVIQAMHSVGAKVFCDITTLEYAKKVQDLGADGVIAVSSGAGGHAGPTSPLVLIPYLKRNLMIPIVAAGGIATGEQVAAALLLGASAVQIGTRFINSEESLVTDAYKKAIINAKPEDIVLTKKISGTPAAVIKTPYIERVGLELNPIEAYLHKHPRTKTYMKAFRAYISSKALEKAIAMPTWKEVWSAGQGVGLINDVLPAGKIIERLVEEFEEAIETCQKMNSATPTKEIQTPAITSA